MGEPESKDIISTTEASVVPNKRKKRRRAPVVKDGGKQGSSGPALLDFSFDVDGSSDNVASQRGRSYSKSLPLLLLGREHGLWSQRKSVFQWQQMMLTCKDGPRATFRRSALRRLAFSSLRTPVSDAILGLENKGSYVLSLGEDSERPDENGDSNSTTPSSLVLRFYSKFTGGSSLKRRWRLFARELPLTSPHDFSFQVFPVQQQ